MVQREEVTALVPTQEVGGLEVDRSSDPRGRSVVDRTQEAAVRVRLAPFPHGVALATRSGVEGLEFAPHDLSGRCSRQVRHELHRAWHLGDSTLRIDAWSRPARTTANLTPHRFGQLARDRAGSSKTRWGRSKPSSRPGLQATSWCVLCGRRMCADAGSLWAAKESTRASVGYPRRSTPPLRRLRWCRRPDGRSGRAGQTSTTDLSRCDASAAVKRRCVRAASSGVRQ
jgi:hypothetical protein